MDKITIAENFLKDISAKLKIKPTVIVTEDAEGGLEISIEGRDLNFLIGYHGESLDGLQTILNQVLFRQLGEWVQCSVDINGYREQRKEKIEEIAKSVIDKVRFHSQTVEMLPMSPFERRVVHMLVSQYDDIESVSEGEGKDRHIILSPKAA